MKLFAHLISNGVYSKEDGTFAYKESRLLLMTEEKPKPVIYETARYTFDKRKLKEIPVGTTKETVYASNVNIESFRCGANNDFSKWLEDIKNNPKVSMITKDAGVCIATFQNSWDVLNKVMKFDLTKTQVTLNDTEKVSGLINLLVTLSPEEYRQVTASL